MCPSRCGLAGVAGHGWANFSGAACVQGAPSEFVLEGNKMKICKGSHCDGIEYCFQIPVAFLLSCHCDPQDIRAKVRRSK